MTNAEAAKFFASLPPDDKAQIVNCQPDSGIAEIVSIKPMADLNSDNYDDDQPIEKVRLLLGFVNQY